MSQILGFGSTGFPVLGAKDRRLMPTYQVIRRQQDRIVDRYQATQINAGYTSDYWPGCSGMQGDQVGDYGVLSAVWRGGIARFAHGAATRVGFVGTTRDANGARLAGVTCSLFRTSDKAWIMDFTSDVNGDFLLQSPYTPDAHFVVFAKTGAPDVIGTTRQTLVGA